MILGLWFALAACGGDTEAPAEQKEEFSESLDIVRPDQRTVYAKKDRRRSVVVTVISS